MSVNLKLLLLYLVDGFYSWLESVSNTKILQNDFVPYIYVCLDRTVLQSGSM
jgi:hypothetical protein